MREAIVTANTVSVRAGRGQNFTQIGTYSKGDRIFVLDGALSDNYTKVLWKAGYAYCEYGRYIKFTGAPIPADELSDNTPNAVVTANIVSVREDRTQTSAKLGEFVKDNKITVLDNDLNQEYSKVIWKVGYAYCAYGQYIQYADSQPETPNANIKKTLDIVKTCVGGKYIIGATGTKITQQLVEQRSKTRPEYFTNGRYEYLLSIGKKCDKSGVWSFPADYAWDCSGLWWYGANKAGIYSKNLDTTANTFFNSYCIPISKAQLRPGDALFRKNSTGRITHMAIVGEGGLIYEAMSGYTGVVQHSSVDDRTAPKIVGTGNLTRGAWNIFGRPKIFLNV